MVCGTSFLSKFFENANIKTAIGFIYLYKIEKYRNMLKWIGFIQAKSRTTNCLNKTSWLNVVIVSTFHNFIIS